MSGIRSTPANPLRQWPALVALWLLYLGLLGVAYVSEVVPSDLSWGQKGALAFFLVLFALGEMGLVVLLDAAVERLVERLFGGLRKTRKGDGGGEDAAPPRPRHRWLDAFKALALALLMTALTASVVKLITAGAHLRVTDLWFLATNFRQLLQESLATELSSVALLAGGFAVLALGLFVTLRHLRAKGPAAPLSSFLILTVAALAGAGVTWLRYDAVGAFARLLVPEIHWLTRTSAEDLTAALPPGTRPPIEPWDPPVAGRSDGGGEAAEGGIPGPHNVLLVMLESVPWSRLGFNDGAPGVTPNLDRLARESIVFSRAYATSVHSDYAQMSILSSLFPRKYDHHDYYQRLEYPRTLLWDALRPAGWRTAMFSCQNEAWGNMIAYLSTPGLELRVHSPDFPPEVPRKGRGVESKVYEEAVVEAWRSWLETGDPEPWLAYLNFQANHFPYTVPPGAPRPYQPWEMDFPASFLSYPQEEIPVMENRFYNALHYADHHFGQVRRTLEERGEWEETAVIVVSDHGEAFYEHEQPTHGTALYEEQVRSVWIMHLPGEAPRRIDEPVSLLDVAPTLLSWLGLPPHGNFQGRDVLDPGYSGEGRPLFFTIQGMTFEDGLVMDGWKYMVHWDRSAHRLFHLPTDPGETTDVAAREPEVAERLQGELLTFLGRQLAYYEEKGWEDGRYPPRMP